jgi:FMN reductase
MEQVHGGTEFMDKHPRTILGILGSVRPGNYTAKAMKLVRDQVESSREFRFELIDPAFLTLPFPGLDDGGSDVQELQAKVDAAVGIVLSTPEYHGGFSSVIKLVIENLGFPSRLSGKPVALLGVAGGAIGAVKSLEQLRGVCSHVGAIVLPGPVSVANVRKVFDEHGNCLDARIEKQVRRVGQGLMDYIDRYVCPAISLEALVRGGTGVQ